MSKTFVGNRVQSVDIGETLEKITRVNLIVDSETMYTAGDDTGRTLEREIPWGTQEMATALLQKLSGVTYTPFSAERAMLNPAFEIGDGVTVGGVYSQIVGADINYNVSGLVDIYAPDLDETDDEYPAQKTQQSSIGRQIAKTRSLIAKTAEEIRNEVFGEGGDSASLVVRLGEVETAVSGKIGEEDASALIKAALEAITLSISGSEGTTTFVLTANGTTLTSDSFDINVKAANVKGTLTAANISANNVTGGTFSGSNLVLDGLLKLVSDNDHYGYIGATHGYAPGKITNGVVMADATRNNGFVATDSGARMSYKGQNEIYCSGDGCRSTSEISVASDRRLKHSISYDLSKEEKMFRSLRPCSFVYNRDKSSKRHFGFIAQDMVESAIEAELETDTLGVVSFDENGMYSVASGEVTPLNTHMIQLLMNHVDKLEETVEKLAQKIKEMEEKNG